MKKVLPLILLVSVFLGACGGNAEPTIDAAQVQASAVAMAFTMSAQTQAAQPTATPLPPTATATVPPPASPTSFLLPTFPAAQATATKSTTGDPCNTSLMDPNPGGPKTYLMIDNQTKGPLSMSLWLAETPFACGFARLPAIGPNENVGVTLPEGCYYPSAYVNDPKKPRSLSGPSFCIHGNDKITLIVTYDGFKVQYP